ncbi:hypothetical protein QBC36DRAFT_382643 [Triangularia setosa]|uniref:Uncharacterized protein n=1 Tax=Triangularia setosa TaxID=2587417 RepID=A0AAN7A3T1_9PEZI|nr:hypothetical protein QBC36DRAFT_382643 [Podospora setosa]
MVLSTTIDILPPRDGFSAWGHMIDGLEVWWKQNFMQLTKLPRHQWEPFNDFHIAAFILMGHRRLREAYLNTCSDHDYAADAESIIATALYMPHLAKLCLPNFEDGTNMDIDEREAAHRVALDYQVRRPDTALCSWTVYHIIPALRIPGLMKICLSGVMRLIQECPTGSFALGDISNQARDLFGSTRSNSYWNMISLPYHLETLWSSAQIGLEPLGPTDLGPKIEGYITIKIQVVPLPSRIRPHCPLPRGVRGYGKYFHAAFHPAAKVWSRSWDWFTGEPRNIHGTNPDPETPRYLYLPVREDDVPRAMLALQLRFATTVATAIGGGPGKLPVAVEDLPDYYDEEERFKGTTQENIKCVCDRDYI